MQPTLTRRHALTLCLAALARPAMAASSASSASSDAASTSVGSVSNSFEKSSNSSSKDKKTAQGDYRIVEVTAADQRPGTLRLKLQALAEPGEAGELILYLPEPALVQAALAPGEVVRATERPYGLEFAKADKAFFLVLDNEWHQGLQTRPVTL